MADPFVPIRRTREILEAQSRRSADIVPGRFVGPVGQDFMEVVTDENCGEVLAASSTPGVAPAPNSNVLVLTPGGGQSRTVISASPRGEGGPIERQSSESGGSREYLSLVVDPVETSRLHILRYADGKFVSLAASVLIPGGTDLSTTSSNLEAAIPIRADNSIVFKSRTVGSVGDFHAVLTRINVPSGDFVEGTTADVSTGSSRRFGIRVIGDFIYMVTLDVTAVLNTRLHRFDYPSLGNSLFLGQMNPGSEKHFDPGIWTADRLRIPRSNAGFTAWTALDEIRLDPAGPPPTATSDVLPGTPGDFAGPVGNSTGHFFTHGVSGTPVELGTLAPTGDGVDAGWPATWLNFLFTAALILSNAEVFVTALGIHTAASGSVAPAFATVPWRDGLAPSILPDITLIDLVGAAQALGFSDPDDAFPSAWLPWF